MPSKLRFLIYLRPPRGPTLVLQEKETWIGRGTFELTERGKSICSRKQACLKNTDTVQIECHGLNPIYFRVCHSVNFKAKEDTPVRELHLLRKGEALILSDGDQFFLAPNDCLLTVGIKPADNEVVPQFTHANDSRAKHDDSVASQVVTSPIPPEQARADYGEGPTTVRTNSPAGPSAYEILRSKTDKDLNGGNSSVFPTVLKRVRCRADEMCVHESISMNNIPTSGFDEVQAPGDNVLIGKSLEPASTTPVVIATPAVPESSIINLSDGTERTTLNSDQGGRMGTAFVNGEEMQELQLDAVSEASYLRHSSEKNEADDKVVEEPSDGIILGEPGTRVAPFVSFHPCSESWPSTSMSVLPECTAQDGLPRTIDDPLSTPSCLAPLDECATAGVEVSALRLTRVVEESPGEQEEMQVHSLSGSVHNEERDRHPVTEEPSNDTKRNRGLQCASVQFKQPDITDLTLSEDEDVRVQVSNECADPRMLFGESDSTGPVRGMECVVATVSGYDSVARARLIGLINFSGALYTGSLSKVNTHMVCWKFEGDKYEMAKKRGKVFVNHRWFEDSLKAGVRLPEAPYSLSGEEVGPLQWVESNTQTCSKQKQSSFSTPMDDRPLATPSSGRFSGAYSYPQGGTGQTFSGGAQGKHSVRSKFDELNRGKRPADMELRISGNKDPAVKTITGPASGAQNECESTLRTITGDGQANGSSAPPDQEQESDEFWNEVIVNFDRKGKQIEGSPCPRVLGLATHDEGDDHRARATRQSNVSDLPSSSREGQRNFVSQDIRLRCDASRPPEALQIEGQRETMQKHLSAREQSSREYNEDDCMTIYPRKSKKRNPLSGNSCGETSRTLRRLVKRQERTSPANESLNQDDRSDLGGLNANELATSSHPAAPSIIDLDSDEEVGLPTNTVLEPPGDGKKKRINHLPNDELICIICHSDAIHINEGVLSCGHKFCYPCIQRWADEAKVKSPTCPLCKVPFEFITYRDVGNARADGQCTSIVEETIVPVVQDVSQPSRTTILRNESLCVACGSRDTSELLLTCTNCGGRACHTFCLDPPQPLGSSWLCSRCSQRQSRLQTREAYGRLFHVIPQNLPGRPRQDVDDSGMSGVAQTGTPSSNGGASLTVQSPRSPSGRLRQHSLRSYLLRRGDA